MSLEIDDTASIERLSGGFRNENFKITTRAHDEYLLRISGNPRQQLEAELSVLNSLRGKVSVPQVLEYQLENTHLNKHVVLLQLLPGRPLCEVEDSLATAQAQDIAQQLGGELAAIHEIDFEQSGFLGSHFTVAKPFTSFSHSFYEYVEQCLADSRLKERLPTPDQQRLDCLFQDNRPRIEAIAQTTSLVHSDFNQKNILVEQRSGRWKVTGILDWEFAFAGCPLIDFGNFFRFEEEQPTAYRPALLEAYHNSGGHLVDDWHELAQLLDLIAMLLFLTREEDSPKTFATARSVIARTLQRLC